MKKIVIAVGALTAAAGISIGALAAVNHKNKEKAEKEARITADQALTDFESADVSQVTINARDGSTFTLVREGTENWSATDQSGESFPANDVAVNGICQAASILNASSTLGKPTPEKLTEYGFDQPYVLDLTLPDKTITVTLGSDTATGTYTYAMISGKDNIYTIPVTASSPLIYDRLGLKNSDLIPFPSEDISSLTAVKDGQEVYSVVRDKETGTWSLDGKYSKMGLSQTILSSKLAILTRITASTLVSDDPADIPKYGLDKPLLEYKVSTYDGKTRTMTVAPDKSDTDYYYIYMDDTQTIGTYLRGDLVVMNFEPFDFMAQLIENPPKNTVSEVTFSCAGGEDKFTYDENATPTCQGQVIDLTNAEINSFYSKFYDLISHFVAEGCDVDSTPDKDDILFSATFTRKTGEVTQYDLVSGPDGKVFAFINGENSCLTSDEGLVNTIISSYKALCDHAGIEPAIK